MRSEDPGSQPGGRGRTALPAGRGARGGAGGGGRAGAWEGTSAAGFRGCLTHVSALPPTGWGWPGFLICDLGDGNW